MSGPAHFCDCKCHKAPDLVWNPVGVDMRDPVATESACAQCQPDHRFAQVDDPPGRALPYEPPRKYDPQADGEGAE